MSKQTYGAEEARKLLPELIERAHHGRSSVITKRGKPYARIVAMDATTTKKPRLPLLALAGSGRGLWGRNSRVTVKHLRGEWE
jgi:prevent-host-death family protein